jgi:hypothetical protein
LWIIFLVLQYVFPYNINVEMMMTVFIFNNLH